MVVGLISGRGSEAVLSNLVALSSGGSPCHGTQAEMSRHEFSHDGLTA